LFATLATSLGGGVAHAAPPSIGLGRAADFAVLAGTTLTTVGSSVIQGDVGLSPGRAATGLERARVLNSAVHLADAAARVAQHDAAVAFAANARLDVTAIVRGDLGGRTIPPGVYAGSVLTLFGTVTLDAQGDPDAVFVFRSSSSVVTAPGSRISLVNGASSCNVTWLAGQDADIGAGTAFVGTVLARTSIDVRREAVIEGRLFARGGAVTLDTNTFTRPACPDVATAPARVATVADTTVAGGTVVPHAEPPRGVPDAAVAGGISRSGFPVHLGRPLVAAFAIVVLVLLAGLGTLALRQRRRALRSGHARLPR
jgi:type VI secretion system secreted protein VgrG